MSGQVDDSRNETKLEHRRFRAIEINTNTSVGFAFSEMPPGSSVRVTDCSCSPKNHASSSRVSAAIHDLSFTFLHFIRAERQDPLESGR